MDCYVPTVHPLWRSWSNLKKNFYFVKTESHYVAQTNVQLLASNDPPVSAPQSAWSNVLKVWMRKCCSPAWTPSKLLISPRRKTTPLTQAYNVLRDHSPVSSLSLFCDPFLTLTPCALVTCWPSPLLESCSFLAFRFQPKCHLSREAFSIAFHHMIAFSLFVALIPSDH